MLDRFLRDLVHKDLSVGGKKIPFLDLLLLLCISATGVMIRSAVFGIAEQGETVADPLRMLYCVLDFVLAIFMAYFVCMTEKSRLKATGIYALAVIWPAIAANSALNGGAEVVYASVLLLLLCVIAGKKFFNPKSFWLIAVLTSGAQMLCSGKAGNSLTNCWPNIYTLFSESGYVLDYGVTGKILVVGILLLIFYYISKLDFSVTPKLLIQAALFFSLFPAVFFPFMNYRSGFLANVFGLLYFFVDKRKWYVPMAMCTISYVSYGRYYNGKTGVFFWIYALGLILLMLDAGASLYRQLHTEESA